MTGPCVASDWNGEEELILCDKKHFRHSGTARQQAGGTALYPLLRLRKCVSGRIGALSRLDTLLEEDYDLCEQLHASECIACGCCSYICPAKRELSVRTRMARDMVKQRMRERAVKKA